MATCEICGEEFANNKIKANHIRWKHRDNTKSIELMKQRAEEKYNKKHGEYIDKTVICHSCGKEFIVNEREHKSKKKYFCSKSCAHRRVPSQKTKELISKGVSDAWKTNPNLQKTATNHLNNRYFASAGEIEVRNYFKSNHPFDEWTFGGRLKFGDTSLTRDLYSKKLKVCIEYDGIWHFKDINGQLKTKQCKDQLLEKWCIDNDYRLIRISEEKYKSNSQEYLELLEDYVYNNINQQIVKIY